MVKTPLTFFLFPTLIITFAVIIGVLTAKPLYPQSLVLGATATPTPQNLGCDRGFREDFNSTTLNLSYFSPDADGTGQSAVVKNDHLTVTADGNASSAYVSTRNLYGGDLLAELDLSPVVQNAGLTGKAQFRAVTADGKYGVVIERHSTGALVFYPIGSGQKDISIGNSQNLHLRLERSGRDFKLYYQIAGNSTLLASYPDLTDAALRFELNAATTDTQAVFDNFSVACLHPAPAVPSPTVKPKTSVPAAASPLPAPSITPLYHQTFSADPVNAVSQPSPVRNFFLWLASLF